MQFVKLSEIQVEPGRFRKTIEEEPLQELVESILEHGLLHPLVVRSTPNGLKLVAGERRLRAIDRIYGQGKTIRFGDTEVPFGCVPVLGVDRSELQARMLELEENLRRVDLPWQERVEAIAFIHDMKKAESEDWTMKDTADLVSDLSGAKTSAPSVRQAVILNRYLSIPEVAKAPSQREAIKRLYRVMESHLRAAIGKKAEESPLANNLVFQQVDAREGLKALQEPIDVYVMDPPYGVGAHRYGLWEARGVVQAQFNDSWSNVSVLLKEVAQLMAEKGPSAHAYVFCDIRRFFDLAEIMVSAGWRVWSRPLIWVREGAELKHTGGNPFYGPVRAYETILFAIHGTRPLVSVSSDVILCPSVPGIKRSTQKPVELYVELLKRSAYPASVVCDPFCGSGPIFGAAHRLGLKAYGFDIDPEAAFLVRERLKEIEEEGIRVK
jgi:ParB/RepB/Spo0J family partition protein